MLNGAAAEVAEEVRLIRIISGAGDRYGNLLIKFMERFGLNCLADAKPEQLRAFVEAEHLIHI